MPNWKTRPIHFSANLRAHNCNAFRLLPKSALPRTANRKMYGTAQEGKAACTMLYTYARIEFLTHACTIPYTLARYSCTMLYTPPPLPWARRRGRVCCNTRLDASLRAIASLRYQFVTHPEPLRLSVQPLPAHLVLIEGDSEMPVDVPSVDPRYQRKRR